MHCFQASDTFNKQQWLNCIRQAKEAVGSAESEPPRSPQMDRERQHNDCSDSNMMDTMEDSSSEYPQMELADIPVSPVRE